MVQGVAGGLLAVVGSHVVHGAGGVQAGVGGVADDQGDRCREVGRPVRDVDRVRAARQQPALGVVALPGVDALAVVVGVSAVTVAVAAGVGPVGLRRVVAVGGQPDDVDPDETVLGAAAVDDAHDLDHLRASGDRVVERGAVLDVAGVLRDVEGDAVRVGLGVAAVDQHVAAAVVEAQRQVTGAGVADGVGAVVPVLVEDDVRQGERQDGHCDEHDRRRVGAPDVRADMPLLQAGELVGVRVD